MFNMETAHALVTKAEEARAAMTDAISALADERMEEIREWFKATFPSMKLKVIFGMGAESITLGDDSRRVSFARRNEYSPDDCVATNRRNGGFAYHHVIEVEPPKNYPEIAQRYTRPYYCLQPLAEALADVMDITDGYRDGCPNDFEVLP